MTSIHKNIGNKAVYKKFFATYHLVRQSFYRFCPGNYPKNLNPVTLTQNQRVKGNRMDFFLDLWSHYLLTFNAINLKLFEVSILILIFQISKLRHTEVSNLPKVKESACQCRSCKTRGFNPWVGKIPWSRKWQPTPVFSLE